MSGQRKTPVTRWVWETAAPLAEGLGLSLWDVTYQKEGADWILRLTIDKEGGVSIDDCVAMTRAVEPALDQADPIPQEYLLEVSSPGLGRRLTRPEHFAAFLGAPVRVKLLRALEDGTKTLEGELLRAGEDGTFELLLSEDASVTLSLDECAAAHLIEDI